MFCSRLERFLVLVLSAFTSYSRATQFYNVSSEEFTGSTPACLNAINSDIQPCRGYLRASRGEVGGSPLTQTQLDNLCTSDCLAGLNNHRSSVSSACSDALYFEEPSGVYYKPTIFSEQLLYQYNIACLKSSGGQYCEVRYGDLISNPSSPGAPNECDSCILKSYLVNLNSPVGAVNDDVKSSFSSLTSSCSATTYTTTSPTPVVISSTPEPSQTCAGTQYSIKPGDTALSVSQSQHTSTDELLRANGLSYDLAAFPTSGLLCIPNTCTLHTLQATDTCASIAEAANITYVQLLTWNYIINRLCSNLGDFVGHHICISNPSGDYALPTTTAPPTSTVTTPAPVPTSNLGVNVTTNCGQYYLIGAGDDCQTVSVKFSLTLFDLKFLNPGINEDCTNLWFNYYYCVQPVGDIASYPGYPVTSTTRPPITPDPVTSLPTNSPDPNDSFESYDPIIPIANNTRVDCYSYIWLNHTEGTSLSDCMSLAFVHDIAYEDFLLWNPSLDPNSMAGQASNFSDLPTACSIAASSSYCVGLGPETETPKIKPPPPSPRGAGEIEGCTEWFQVLQGVQCQTIYEGWGLTLAEFFTFNPSVNADCSGLSLGTYYCVSTTDPGSTTTPISTGTPTTTSPTTTTTTTSIATPSPIQEGMVSGCNKFHLVMGGEGCWGIADANGITTDDLYSWNPAIGVCENLYPDFYVCVGRATATATTTTTTPTTTTPTTTTSTGISTPTPYPINMAPGCKTFYKIVAGDYCWLVADKNGITVDDFKLWNPDLGADCVLWPDYYYCVGH